VEHTSKEAIHWTLMVVSLQTRRSLKGARLSRKEMPRVAILTKIPELLRGVSFSIPRDSPDMYLKAVKRLGYMYALHTKNGSDVQMCIDEEELPENAGLNPQSSLEQVLMD